MIGWLSVRHYLVSNSTAAITSQQILIAHVASIGGEVAPVATGWLGSGLSIPVGGILAIGSFGAGYSLGTAIRKYAIPEPWNQVYGDAMYNGTIITTNFYGITNRQW